MYEDDTPVPGYDPTSVPATLVRLLDHGRPDDVLQALTWALETRPIAWDVPATPEGLTLPEAWVKASALRTHGLPAAWFGIMDTWSSGAVWARTDAHGETLLHLALRAYYGLGAVSDAIDETLAELIRRTDAKVLAGWTEVRLESPQEQPGTEAPDTLIDHLMTRVALHALHATFERGMTLLGDQPSTGRPRASEIRHVALWEAFQAQGGDPEVPVPPPDHHANPQPRPLWQVLRKLSPTSSHLAHQEEMRLRTLTVAVEQWARDHRPDAFERLEQDEYWAALRADRADGSALKSRTDWPELRDDHGRTTLMALVTHNARFLKDVWTIKKAAPAFAATDHDGRSLWFYLLAHNAHQLPEKGMDWLVQHVPLGMDRQGWGLVQQCLMTPGVSANGVNLFSSDWPEAWLPDTDRWWGTAAAQDQLADHLMARSFKPRNRMNKGLGPSFAELATVSARVPCWPVTPRLLGAFVVNTLAHMGSQGGTPRDCLDRTTPWLDAGAQVSIPPEVLEGLHALFVNRASLRPTLMAVLGRMEANALTSTLSQAVTTRPEDAAPRRRL